MCEYVTFTDDGCFLRAWCLRLGWCCGVVQDAEYVECDVIYVLMFLGSWLIMIGEQLGHGSCSLSFESQILPFQGSSQNTKWCFLLHMFASFGSFGGTLMKLTRPTKLETHYMCLITFTK